MATLFYDKVAATYSDSPVTQSRDWHDGIDDDEK